LGFGAQGLVRHREPNAVCWSVRHRYAFTMPIPNVDPVTNSAGVVKGVVGKVAMSSSGPGHAPDLLHRRRPRDSGRVELRRYPASGVVSQRSAGAGSRGDSSARKLPVLSRTACGRWPSDGFAATTSTRRPPGIERFLWWRSHQLARPVTSGTRIATRDSPRGLSALVGYFHAQSDGQ